MTSQPQKAYWKTHPYKRRSVEQDVEKFMGWKKLGNILECASQIKTNLSPLMLRNVVATCFAGAFRINECLRLKPDNLLEHPNCIEVVDAPLSKRYRKKDVVIYCRRCGFKNDKFEVECQNCGANLVMGGGQKRFVTEKLPTKRQNFAFPKSEPTSQVILDMLERHEGSYWLFENHHNKKPVSDSWVLWHLSGKRNPNNIQRQVGVPLWNHRFRSERLTHLGMVKELGGYEMTKDELKAFSGIIEDSTLWRYAKSKENYMHKMGIT